MGIGVLAGVCSAGGMQINARITFERSLSGNKFCVKCPREEPSITNAWAVVADLKSGSFFQLFAA